MRHTIEAAVLTAIVLVHLSTGGCASPAERCEEARSDAADAWREYATELGSAPEIPLERVLDRMHSGYDRYDAQCRTRYGIAAGPDAEMSDEQADALIACRSVLPAADVGAWPPAEAAMALSRTTSAPVDDYARLVAQFRWEWDRGPRAGPSRTDVYESSAEIVSSCRTSPRARTP